MRRKILMFLVVSLCFMIVNMQPNGVIANNDFEGNEEQWLKTCSVAQETQEEVNTCKAFKEYYQNQQSDLEAKVATLKDEVAQVQGDIEKLKAAIAQQEELIAEIDARIQQNLYEIDVIDDEIYRLDGVIYQLELSIEERDTLIRTRMQEHQASVGTNFIIEIVMGSDNIVDMIRRIDGLNRIDEAERDEIKQIEIEKAEVEFQKGEQERLKQQQETLLAKNRQEEQNAIAVKEQKEILHSEFEKLYEKLNAEMREIEVDISTLQDNIAQINPELAEQQVDFDSNSILQKPVPGYISANSFHYPNGSIHMGADIAVSIGTPMYAPANGIILYANNPVPTNSGYIGNRDGYPAGTGNSIHMITSVNGTTYALSFFHMAQESFMVRAGDVVQAGQLLGLSGNTGNTTGPHCHLEVFNLGNMSIEDAVRQFQATADFSWGNGWYAVGYQNICDVSGPPCREHPEDVYGYR